MSHKRLWWAFAAVVVVSFAVLLYYGGEIYRKAPPVPDRIFTIDGQEVFIGADIRTGQNVWQSIVRLESLGAANPRSSTVREFDPTTPAFR